MQHHKYSLTELENMIPWEKDIYVNMLIRYLEEENDKKIVMKYIKQYDNETIRQALDGQLEISPTLLEVLNSHYNIKKIGN